MKVPIPQAGPAVRGCGEDGFGHRDQGPLPGQALAPFPQALGCGRLKGDDRVPWQIGSRRCTSHKPNR